MIDVTTNARWTPDCCGKQDLDFTIVSCHTRYWPDHIAKCEIVFLYNFCWNELGDDPYVDGDIKPITISESEYLKGKDEADTKQKVKEWYNDNMIRALKKSLYILRKGETK